MSTTTSLDDLENRIRSLEIDTEGESKKLQQITTLLKFAVLIPLTIVVGNHLGSFLPLPVVCKEYSFGGVTTRLMSHMLLLFLIGFSISGNIDYSIFGWTGVTDDNKIIYDLFFTILSWLFLLMLLRLRHTWMYIMVGALILLAYVFFLRFKSAYDARMEKLKTGETVSTDQEKTDYQAAFYILLTMFLLVVIFYCISAYQYVRSLPNYNSTYTKPIKLMSGEKYFIQQPKMNMPEKIIAGVGHMFNPEIPSDSLCAEFRSKDFELSDIRRLIPSNKVSKFGKTVEQIKDEVNRYSKEINKYSPSLKREIFEQKSFLDNIPTKVYNPLKYFTSKASIVEKKSFADIWEGK